MENCIFSFRFYDGRFVLHLTGGKLKTENSSASLRTRESFGEVVEGEVAVGEQVAARLCDEGLCDLVHSGVGGRPEVYFTSFRSLLHVVWAALVLGLAFGWVRAVFGLGARDGVSRRRDGLSNRGEQ